MATTTNLVEATLPRQLIGPHFHSQPGPGSRFLPLLTPPMRMSWCVKLLSSPSHPSRRPSSKPMPNTGVFCRFHQFNGHDTESCVALCNIIEGLIREGKLDNYVHNLAPLPNPHQRQINMISTISGGPTLVGTSNNSIKHYVRSTYAHQVFNTEQGRLPKTQRSGWAPITFCEEEERGVILPHDNPLIIQADISNFDVGRILVDTGSSVSVMFADAFNEL
ncbi:uncharacterized protein LOC109948079 [Prunus persica]|uniref:uncharacterized protein LOC109948079 n=1 Tax=Prunus persica TaxID=3760 RepID=UPI0009AB82E0|nr:uncharacterized protein LOC109948079 [Prunus persica]